MERAGIRPGTLSGAARLLWRITTGAHPVWSGDGARWFGQRWNPPGMAAIYTGTKLTLCLVAVLVRANRKTPPSGARCVAAEVPDAVSREMFDPAAHPGWDDVGDVSVAPAFGRRWIGQRRSALLFVPSVVTGGRDLNAVVNPAHPDARLLMFGRDELLALNVSPFGQP